MVNVVVDIGDAVGALAPWTDAPECLFGALTVRVLASLMEEVVVRNRVLPIYGCVSMIYSISMKTPHRDIQYAIPLLHATFEFDDFGTVCLDSLVYKPCCIVTLSTHWYTSLQLPLLTY